MLLEEEQYLEHYGILRKSGRYPWGSGDSQEERNASFLTITDQHRKEGMSDSQIAKYYGMSRDQLQAGRAIAKQQQKAAQISEAERLKAKGMGNTAIAEKMKINESSVRSLLAPGAKDRNNAILETANMVRDQFTKQGKRVLDIGAGVSNQIGVTETKLKNAVAILKEEGYNVFTLKQRQAATRNQTTRKVLAEPGLSQKDVWSNQSMIEQFVNFSDDHGRSFYGLHDPIQIDPKRVQVIHAEEGGNKADGMIYLRPGKDDLSLGGKNYAQVRIMIGPDHYIKGMAMYRDDLPDGVDIQFNTSKRATGNKLDAMKPIAEDADNPFGSIVRQIVEHPGTPQERVTSAINIVSGKTSIPDSGNVEGKWADWSKNLSSQMLSKQKPELARSQLDMTFEHRQNDLEAIRRLTNPTVRKKLLEDFADTTDSAAVHLQAAALPRQGTRVLLPLHNIKPDEVYAPSYKQGEKVVLIRHPHGGTFEIPELTVNKRNPEGRKLLGDAVDAIGIHHSVAERLSGADFDGDAVLVIPNNMGRVTHTEALEHLKDFDPINAYPGYPGMKPYKNTQADMGKVSNLITDMTLRNADRSELARAIKHSMVVIDAEKHNLNVNLSYNDNGIKQLKEKYQSGGASTLLSRARSPRYIPERKPRTAGKGGPVNKLTGQKEFEPTKAKTAKGELKKEKVAALALETDAHRLSSGLPMEVLYANHSNRLKSMANQARLDALNTPPIQRSTSAAQTYKAQVDSLNSKLAVAKKNAPLERQAQQFANQTIRLKKDQNPNMKPETEKKVRWQSLEEARRRTGADKQDIKITQDEWDAIQANALSNSNLNEILKHADMKVVRELSKPKTDVLMTSNEKNRAASMVASGYTREEIARALGVSLSTLDRGLKD